MSFRLFLLTLSTILSVVIAGGCTASSILRDKFYPADWPDIIGAGDDCHGIEGTFANKGTLVDEAGHAKEIWLTDLFYGPSFRGEERFSFGEEEKFSARRSCERVSLTVETYTFTSLSRPVTRQRLIITPSRKIASDPQAQFEPCESMHLPRSKGYPFEPEGKVAPYENGFAVCTNNFLYYENTWGARGQGWHFVLASDGTLLVRVNNERLWAFYPVIWWTTEKGWARFSKFP